MLHTTSLTRQAKLAADYRESDIRQATLDRGGSGADRPVTSTGTPATSRVAGNALARLVTLLPHSH